MNTAERIEKYTRAAVKATGQPVRRVIVQKGRVEVIFSDAEKDDGEGLRKDWGRGQKT